MDLIGRYGQGRYAGVGSDSAFLVADSHEACLLEAAGRHWVVAEVGSVRAATGYCLLRQDWDRISRGLSDVAIGHGWWPEDGCKLDFAGALGENGPEHARDMRRWGLATLRLEQHSGHIDAAFLRELLRDQAELVEVSEEMDTMGSLLVPLGPARNELPMAWLALGTPSNSVFFPLLLTCEMPVAFQDEAGKGSKVWRTFAERHAECKRDARLRAEWHSGLASLQERLDEHMREFWPEAKELHRQGQTEELRRLASSFLQYNVERFEELDAMLHPRTRASVAPREEELVVAW
jgi:dipeptidase